MPPILEPVGYGVLLPAVVTVVALLLALRLGGGEPLAVGVGVAAGFVALAATGQITWGFLRPAESWDGLPALALLAVIAAFEEQTAKHPRIVRWVGRVIVAGLAAALLVVRQSAREPLGIIWYPAVALAVLALWEVLDLAARRRPSRLAPALLALVAVAAAAIAELGGFATVALMGSVAVGALAGWAVVAGWRPDPAVCRAGIPVLAVLVPGLLFVSFCNAFADVPAASYLLTLAAPLCLGGAALLCADRLSRVWEVAVLVASALVPLGAGVALAARA
jgi:hypothetical protein